MPAEEQVGAGADADTWADFAAYVAERRPVLLRWARAVAGDPHSAEDLLQESLLRVLPHWAGLRDRAAADAYVRRTITRQHVSALRRPCRREVTTASVPETWRPDERRTPEVWGLVLALPGRQRSAVALRFYEELSIAETAAVLGCSTGTVKSNTSRGLAALRRVADQALAG